ncbi:MAG: tRNA (cytidine(34)-2'-O)-methyltransferase [Deltaproteobacteria bacterium]
MLNVVLVHPEIPPTTGNIGRLCCAVGATLHLVKPLGFRIDDASLRRAGLDYWEKVKVVVWQDIEEYLSSVTAEQIVLTSSKRGKVYFKVPYGEGDHLLFGAETSGLPAFMYQRFPRRVARIPVDLDKVRSLNLATSAGIIVYEALRQIGRLPGLGW